MIDNGHPYRTNTEAMRAPRRRTREDIAARNRCAQELAQALGREPRYITTTGDIRRK